MTCRCDESFEINLCKDSFVLLSTSCWRGCGGWRMEGNDYDSGMINEVILIKEEET